MSGERGNKNRRTDERQNQRPQGRSVEIVRHRLRIQSCPKNSTRWKTGAVDMWPAAAAFSIQFPQRFAMGVETATSSPYTTTTIRKLPLSDGEIDVAQNEACGENPYQPSNFAEFASSDFHHRIGDQPQAETSAMLKVNGVASMVMKDRTDSLNSLHSM